MYFSATLSIVCIFIRIDVISFCQSLVFIALCFIVLDVVFLGAISADHVHNILNQVNTMGHLPSVP